MRRACCCVHTFEGCGRAVGGAGLGPRWAGAELGRRCAGAATGQPLPSPPTRCGHRRPSRLPCRSYCHLVDGYKFANQASDQG